MRHLGFQDLQDLEAQKKRLFEELGAYKINSRKWRKTFKLYLSCFETLKFYQKR